MNGLPAEPELDANLARNLKRALTAGSEELFSVLREHRPEVLRAALKNPRLNENHLLALLKRRDLSEDLLKTISLLDSVQRIRPLQVALVKNPATPGPIVQSLLPGLFLFELVALCYFPGATPDQKFAAERVIIQRLPQVELGNKLTLARRATSTVVAEILKEGNPRLMEVCLNNPRIKEAAILQFLNSGRTTAETISTIARHPKWRDRPNLRLAILKNPRTPGVWYTLFLPRLQSHQIRILLASRRLTPGRKQLLRDQHHQNGLG